MTGEGAGVHADGGTRPRSPVGRPRRAAARPDRDPRLEIIAAASHLFARNGVAATPMSAIAEGAGLGQSSIYYYFRNKQAILHEIVGTVNRDPLAFLARIRAEGGSPAAQLFRFVRFDVRALCQLPYDINEVHRISAQDPAAFRSYRADRQELNHAVEDLVRAGTETGELRRVDPRLTSLVVLANDEGVQNWFRPVGDRRLRGREGDRGDYSPDEIGRHLAEMTLLGLLARPETLPVVVAAADELDRPHPS